MPKRKAQEVTSNSDDDDAQEVSKWMSTQLSSSGSYTTTQVQVVGSASGSASSSGRLCVEQLHFSKSLSLLDGDER